MQRDASTNMNRVGGKSCEILLFGDVVYNVGSSAESSIDVCRADEFNRAINKASGGEYSKGVIMWEVKVVPPLDYAKPGRDSTESGGWSHVGGLMDANKCLLLIPCLILLITPLEINLMDEIRTSEGVGQSVATSAFTKELQI